MTGTGTGIKLRVCRVSLNICHHTGTATFHGSLISVTCSRFDQDQDNTSAVVWLFVGREWVYSEIFGWNVPLRTVECSVMNIHNNGCASACVGNNEHTSKQRTFHCGCPLVLRCLELIIFCLCFWHFSLISLYGVLISECMLTLSNQCVNRLCCWMCLHSNTICVYKSVHLHYSLCFL